MPLIVYKELELVVLLPQMKRMWCEHCTHPFTLLATETVTESVSGIPVIESDQRLTGVARERIVARVRAASQRERAGRARCPQCGLYQAWMMPTLRTHPVITWVLIMAVLGMLFYGAGHYLFDVEGPVREGWFLTAIGGGALVGMGLGLIERRTPAKARLGDPRSCTDDQLDEFLAECSEAGTDPTWEWFASVQGERPVNAHTIVLLGLHDTIGDYPVPDDLLPEGRLDSVEIAFRTPPE